MEIAQVHARPDDISHPCPNCHRDFGSERSCQYCGQVDGYPVGVQLSSVGRRFGAFLLDALLFWVLLWIGYIIWSLIVFGRGQTPGKQILGMRTVVFNEGRKASWGLMFLRQVVYQWLLFSLLIPTLTLGFGYLLYFWLVWDKNNQELWDKMAGTIVIDDPKSLFAHDAEFRALPTAPPAASPPAL